MATTARGLGHSGILVNLEQSESGDEDEAAPAEHDTRKVEIAKDLSLLRRKLASVQELMLSDAERNRRVTGFSYWLEGKLVDDEVWRGRHCGVIYRVIKKDLEADVVIRAYEGTMIGLIEGKIANPGSNFIGLITKIEEEAALDEEEAERREEGRCYPPTTGKL